MKTLRERDHAHGCAKAARNTGHNHIRDWCAGVLSSCGDRVETEQFVSEYEPEKRLRADVRQSQTWEGARLTWTTGTHEGAESEHKGQAHEDRAVKAAETNKMRDYNPLPKTQAVHIIPMTCDVYGRWGERAELALKQAASRRLEKRDALRATRSERSLGALAADGELKEQ